MTKKITSFFQKTSIPKISQRDTLSGAKRSRDGDVDDGFFAAIGSAGDVFPNLSDNCAALENNKSRRPSPSSDHVYELISFLYENKAEGLSPESSITLFDQESDHESHGKITCTWLKALRKHFQTANFQKLADFVARERQTFKIYPPPASVWSALNSCPLHKVKVVIVGQDPYHGHKQAHGLSFSVEPGCAVPPSLKNIFKELTDDPDVDFPRKEQPRHGHLVRWANQGVLLLNAVLTVRDSQPNSHQNQGWEKVTDEIIRSVLLHRCSSMPNENQAPRGCVFLLWGKPATAKAMNVIESSMRDLNLAASGKTKTHVVITTSHPSPLGARKTATPFLGSRCFSRCNQALKQMGHNPIDWNVD